MNGVPVIQPHSINGMRAVPIILIPASKSFQKSPNPLSLAWRCGRCGEVFNLGQEELAKNHSAEHRLNDILKERG